MGDSGHDRISVGVVGVEAGTAWENVAESFLCPVCFMGKDDFVPVADAAAKAA